MSKCSGGMGDVNYEMEIPSERLPTISRQHPHGVADKEEVAHYGEHWIWPNILGVHPSENEEYLSEQQK